MNEDQQDVAIEIIIKRIEALHRIGVLLDYCESHGRDFVQTSDDGEEYCQECAADGGSGELCYVAPDSFAIEVVEEISRTFKENARIYQLVSAHLRHERKATFDEPTTPNQEPLP